MKIMAVAKYDTKDTIQETIKWLKSEGLNIYKIIDIENTIQTRSIRWVQRSKEKRVLFYVMDAQVEMMLKLKYPPGTFIDYVAT